MEDNKLVGKFIGKLIRSTGVAYFEFNLSFLRIKSMFWITYAVELISNTCEIG